MIFINHLTIMVILLIDDNVKNKYSMKRILEEIINRNIEGNYLLSSSDKAQMISEILDLLGVISSLLFT